VFHNGKLQGIMNELVMSIKNPARDYEILIFIDESHFGNAIGSTLFKLLKAAGIIDIIPDNMSKKSLELKLKQLKISIVLVSATDFTIKRHREHSVEKNIVEACPTIKLESSKDYVSIRRLLEDGHIIHVDNSNLARGAIPGALAEALEERKKENKYNLIRLPGGRAKDRVVTLASNLGYKVLFYDSEEKDFSRYHLEIEPNRPTIVLIKNYWRVAQTLCKKHIGFLWSVSPNSSAMSTVVQDFPGRMTGYYSKEERANLENITIYANRNLLMDFVSENYKTAKKADNCTRIGNSKNKSAADIEQIHVVDIVNSELYDYLSKPSRVFLPTLTKKVLAKEINIPLKVLDKVVARNTKNQKTSRWEGDALKKISPKLYNMLVKDSATTIEDYKISSEDVLKENLAYGMRKNAQANIFYTLIKVGDVKFIKFVIAIIGNNKSSKKDSNKLGFGKPALIDGIAG
jgi:hypothetical protein